MRMFVNLFTMIIVAMLPATVLASATVSANTAQQPSQPKAAPATQAANQPVAPKPAAEEVLLPGSTILAGDPDKNEFFIVGKDQPTPPALIEERKLAEERLRPQQVALDETRKTIEEMNVPKLEKAFGAKAPTIAAQAKTSAEVVALIKQAPIVLQAENEVSPQISSPLTAPVITDATSASSETKTIKQVEPAVKKSLAKNTSTTELKSVAKAVVDKKTTIKHVFNASTIAATVKVQDSKSAQTKKHIAAQANTKQSLTPNVKAIDVKALLAKVEVVKPNLSHATKSNATKPTKAKTADSKPSVPKPVVATVKKVHLSLAQTKEEVKHGNTRFKVKSVTVN